MCVIDEWMKSGVLCVDVFLVNMCEMVRDAYAGD